ncbi:hypothetical protein Ancab_028691 [Ancistrocladus abbreviatus]
MAGPSCPNLDLNSRYVVDGVNWDPGVSRQLFIPSQGRSLGEQARDNVQSSCSGVGVKRKELNGRQLLHEQIEILFLIRFEEISRSEVDTERRAMVQYKVDGEQYSRSNLKSFGCYYIVKSQRELSRLLVCSS